MPSPREFRARKQVPHGIGETLWNLDQVNRLLAQARTIDGFIGDVRASLWWPAFLLTLFDTAVSHRDLLTATRTNFQSSCGQLSVGMLVYSLNPMAVSAVNAIIDDTRSTLFPCPWNGSTLTARLSEILDAAEVPQRTNPFLAIRQTAKRFPNLLNSVDYPVALGPVAELVEASPVTTLVRSLPVAEVTHQTTVLIVTRDQAATLGRSLPEFDGTLVGFVDLYADSRLEIKRDTVKGLRYVANLLSNFSTESDCNSFEPLMLDSLSASLVLRWMKSLLAAGRSPRTVNSYRQSILTLWRMAADRHLAPPVPSKYDLPACNAPRVNPVAWDIPQLQRLIAVCESLTGFMQSCRTIRRSDFWFSLILFLYESGARIGAALAIRPADINIEEKSVNLRDDSAKTHLEQWIRISPLCAESIATIIDPAREKVWPCGKHRKELYNRLKQLLKAAGLPTDRKRKFHCFRRTTATHTAIHGSMDMAQRQLGHATMSMTMKYIDQQLLRPKQAVDVIPQLVSVRSPLQKAQ